MKQVLESLNVTHLRTSPSHLPQQTDGLVGRFNGTIKTMMRRFLREASKNWDELLPYLLFASREFLQASTGFSPVELLYGGHVRGFLGILKESWVGEKEDSEAEQNVLEFVVKKTVR